MNEDSRYIAGVDVGTASVKCVIAKFNNDNKPSIVGVGKRENGGMKHGVVTNMKLPMKAIDLAVSDAEKMAGTNVDAVVMSINGAHISSIKTDGMIAISSPNQEVTYEDIDRLEEVASIGKVDPNREILGFIPYSYNLDEQKNISDPYGMTGIRLEVYASVISASAQHTQNLRRIAEDLKIGVDKFMASVTAAANVVLDDRQREAGVAVIDLGASTSSVAVYEDGELQFVKVVPLGGNNVTNDLAICLEITPDIAEDIKIKHVVATGRDENHNIVAKRDREHYSFNTEQIDEIVQARLEEIFEKIRDELKISGYDKQLPSGVVLTGGGANMKKIAQFAKKELETAVTLGTINIESSVTNEVKNLEFATAVGLTMDVIEDNQADRFEDERHVGFFAKLFGKKR